MGTKNRATIDTDPMGICYGTTKETNHMGTHYRATIKQIIWGLKGNGSYGNIV